MRKRANFSDEHARIVNEILPGLDAMAAYRVGIGSSMALIFGLEPTRNLLETCARSESIEEAAEFSRAWAWRELLARKEQQQGGAR